MCVELVLLYMFFFLCYARKIVLGILGATLPGAFFSVRKRLNGTGCIKCGMIYKREMKDSEGFAVWVVCTYPSCVYYSSGREMERWRGIDR